MQEFNAKRDEELVSLSRVGIEGATTTLLERYKNTVRGIARSFFLAGGEAEDLMQEGMIGLYQAIGDYSADLGKSFKNFAYLCVTRKMQDAVKGSMRMKNSPLNHYVSIFDPDYDFTSLEDSPEDSLIDRESWEELKFSMTKELSDFEFKIMTMYLDGESFSRIMEATGKSRKSIDNALSRAKKKLQAVYGNSTARR